MSYKAAVTAPHYLAAQAGERILQQGGNAVEACVAMASSLTVVYPHMTSLGGDGFWLIHKPGEDPIAINAAGQCANDLTHAEFGHHSRGAKVALTTAGAVAGWDKALSLYPGNLGLDDLFQSAIEFAQNGIEVTQTLHDAQIKLLQEIDDDDFSSVFLKQGKAHAVGDTIRLPALAHTYQRLAKAGLQDWYQGTLAEQNAQYLQKKGSPICLEDIASSMAKVTTPLKASTQWGDFYNFGVPTQGGASLNILALLDHYVSQRAQDEQYWNSEQGEEELLHYLVESVKVAFNWRNCHLSDHASLDAEMQQRLTASAIKAQSETISDKAKAWPNPGPTGDTVWMGVVDSEGLAVSYIQSIYWEFGSGVVNPETGVVWNNRCLGFSTDPTHANYIRPGQQPMHTLNPPLALLKDGSRFIYGTMGGEGQPQTQAAIVWRYLVQKQTISNAIRAPRWLLGKTWGKASENLKLEETLFNKFAISLQDRGHDVVSAADFAEFFGHAGAIHVSKSITSAASDPRSDGEAIVNESGR
ncbi:gamma-glutamyltransferase family protein [Vibrio sp. MA40-2]|uniref:gamma-glutamyltransferase family protein n=1 Tax=Vibrio sp. MA40-2 TaxID=3391828 RepID=UPI0039A5211D